MTAEVTCRAAARIVDIYPAESGSGANLGTITSADHPGKPQIPHRHHWSPPTAGGARVVCPYPHLAGVVCPSPMTRLARQPLLPRNMRQSPESAGSGPRSCVARPPARFVGAGVTAEVTCQAAARRDPSMMRSRTGPPAHQTNGYPPTRPWSGMIAAATLPERSRGVREQASAVTEVRWER